MNKFYIFTFLFLMTNAPMVWAHDTDTIPDIDKRACQMLADYRAEENVISADYQPGVDVNGDPVVEADLSPSPVTMPDSFEFDITVDIAKYTNMNIPTGVEGQGKIGTVRMTDGKLYFNDSPLEGQAIAALRALCDEKRPENPADDNE